MIEDIRGYFIERYSYRFDMRCTEEGLFVDGKTTEAYNIFLNGYYCCLKEKYHEREVHQRRFLYDGRLS